jgi:hypothetical protein
MAWADCSGPNGLGGLQRPGRNAGPGRMAAVPTAWADCSGPNGLGGLQRPGRNAGPGRMAAVPTAWADCSGPSAWGRMRWSGRNAGPGPGPMAAVQGAWADWRAVQAGAEQRMTPGGGGYFGIPNATRRELFPGKSSPLHTKTHKRTHKNKCSILGGSGILKNRSRLESRTFHENANEKKVDPRR